MNGNLSFSSSDWSGAAGQSIRTEGCVVLLCEQGVAVVSVEFKRRALRRGDIVLIFPDTMFAVIGASRLFRVKSIEVAPSLFDEATFALSSQFFDAVYDNPIFHAGASHSHLLAAWETLLRAMSDVDSPKSAYMMLRNHLQSLFLWLECAVMTDGSRSLVEPASPARQLFNRFRRLVVKHCHE